LAEILFARFVAVQRSPVRDFIKQKSSFLLAPTYAVSLRLVEILLLQFH